MNAPVCPNCGKLTVRHETGHHPGWGCPECRLLKPDKLTRQENHLLKLCRNMSKARKRHLVEYMRQLYAEKQKCHKEQEAPMSGKAAQP